MIRKILELDTATRSDRYRMFHRLPSEYAAVPRTLNGAARRKVRPREERESRGRDRDREADRDRDREADRAQRHSQRRGPYTLL